MYIVSLEQFYISINMHLRPTLFFQVHSFLLVSDSPKKIVSRKGFITKTSNKKNIQIIPVALPTQGT